MFSSFISQYIQQQMTQILFDIQFNINRSIIINLFFILLINQLMIRLFSKSTEFCMKLRDNLLKRRQFKQQVIINQADICSNIPGILLKLMMQIHKNYFTNNGQNAFLSPLIRTSVMKTITSIIAGEWIKENQHKLNELRQQSQYPLILCELLTMLRNNTLMQQSMLQTYKKNFILLEIKKNFEKLRNEQCWWLLRDVYFSDNDKTAKMIREVCLSYEKYCRNGNQTESENEENYLGIFFTINLQNLGLVGIIRYLSLVHSLMSSQLNSLQMNSIKNHIEVIVKKIVEFIQWDLPTRAVEFALCCLIMLKGFFVERSCWDDRKSWTGLLNRVVSGTHKQGALLNYLAVYLEQQLQTSQQLNQSFFIESIKKCLQKTRDYQTEQFDSDRLFYFDCLVMLELGWRRMVKGWLGIDGRIRNDKEILVYEVIDLFAKEFHLSVKGEKKWLMESFTDIQGIQNDSTQIFAQNRNKILKTTFQLIPRDQLQSILNSNSPTLSFLLTFMHLSTHYPCLNNQFYAAITIQSCLNQLQYALREQSDTYLFYKEKSQLVDILMRYIARYYTLFKPQLLLKSSYLVDLLATKCDSTAEQCYELLSMFSEQLQFLFASDLVPFIETSLTHINSNQWQQTPNCYSHVIKLIVGIDPMVIFSPQQHSASLPFHQSFEITSNPMEKLILQMLKNIIATLFPSFDYQQTHNLNLILMYLINNAPHICKELTYQNFHDIVQTNFAYEILTPESADVYFYFTQFSEQKQIFINSVNLYQFWEQCESQKLQFFVHVYLKLIHPENGFFPLSETDHKLNELKKNLWHRFVSQEDEDERQKIVSVFEKHPEELSSLFEEFHKITLWSQNKPERLNERFKDNLGSKQEYFFPPKMQLQ